MILDIQDVKILGISQDIWFSTLVPTFVSISIFILGYIFNRIYENKKRKRELKEIKEYYLTLLKLLLPATQRQADNFLKLSKALENPDSNPLRLESASAFNFDNIQNISHFDLFNIYIKGRTREEIEKRTPLFNQLHISLKLLEDIKNNFEKKCFGFAETIKGYEIQWRQNVNDLREEYDKEANRIAVNRVKTGQDPFFERHMKLRDELLKLPNYKDRKVQIQHYILPLADLCNEFLSDQRASLFIKLAAESISTHTQLEFSYNQFRNNLSIHAERMMDAKNEIQKAIDELG